jgi:hypothetical protein
MIDLHNTIMVVFMLKTMMLTVGYVVASPTSHYSQHGINRSKIINNNISNNFNSKNNNPTCLAFADNSGRQSPRNVELNMSSRFSLRNLFKPSSIPVSTATPPVDTAAQNDLDIDIPRIAVKPRPLVSLDKDSGKYIPPPPAEDASETKQRQQQQQNQQQNSYNEYESEYSQLSGWGNFKDFVYDTFETVTSIPSALGIFGFSKVQTTNSILNRKLAVAYSDTVEFKAQSGGGTLKSILSDDGESRSGGGTGSANSRPASIAPGPELIQKYESSLSASNKDRSDGEDLFRTDARRNFDSAKDGIYDLFSGSNKNQQSTSSADTPKAAKKSPLLKNLSIPPTDATPSSSTISIEDPTFKPQAKPSANKDETITNLTPYLADLDSPNPIKVLKAKYAIASEERKRKRRIQEQKRRESIDGIKRVAYEAVDSVNSVYTTIVGLPNQVEEAIQETKEAIEQSAVQTRKTVKEVQAIPSKVQQAVEDTKRTVQETQRATLEAVEEVKSIPKKVERTVSDTKKSIQETKEGVENFAKKVDDLTFQAKVVAGIEKPKPKPPPPPPPPKTSKEIAMDVAGVVAKTTGKAAVVVGKGTIGLTTSAVKVAYNVAVEKAKENEEKESKKKQEKGPSANTSLLSKFANTTKKQKKHEEIGAKEDVLTVSPESPALEKPTTTIGEIDPMLELEVADALRSAEEALDSVKQEKANPTSKLSTTEINDSLERARAAATQARKDADELQSMLKKRKVFFFQSRSGK